MGYRIIIRTLMALFGNVEHAEFRFNALELRHVFDTTTHFQSLIAEFYVAQGLCQKMALLTSNSLVGNPSALFDSIATGTRDFFVEPARAKSSAEFIAGIGRGSSFFLTKYGRWYRRISWWNSSCSCSRIGNCSWRQGLFGCPIFYPR